MSWEERVRRHATESCLACLIGFARVLALAYWIGPTERLDRTVLDAAGSLAMSLAFFTVVPLSWRRSTAVAGVAFTFYISFGVLVLNYHYPGDVVAGWLLAAGWWFALMALLTARSRARLGE